MTRARKRMLRHYAVACAFGIAAAITFTALQKRSDVWDYVGAVLVAFFITFGAYIVEHKLGPRLARLSFFASFAGHLFGFVAVVFISFYAGIVTARMIERRTHPFDQSLHRDMLQVLSDPKLFQAYGWALVVIGILVAHREFSRKLGPGVLRNWMLGRYHEPRQEERVFMFLDIKGSTALAEQLGDLKFSELVREFFADISPAIVETLGEVSHFIGDEVVITWPIRNGIEDANCVRCFFLAAKEIENKKTHYIARFGAFPQFKAGLHAGTVVATEVGTMKSEIVFHGDVVNTTARIQAYCNETQCELLISEDLLSRTILPFSVESKSLGEFKLKGKQSAVNLFCLCSRATEGLSTGTKQASTAI